MKLHGAVGTVLFCLLAGSLGAAGCSSSSDSGTGGGDDSGGNLPPPTGCTADDTLDCSGGGTGFACDAGDNPEAEDATYTCSVPTPNGSEDDFCCFTGFSGGSTCTADDGLTAACPDPDSYGFVCGDPSDDPTSLDGSLNCSSGVADPDGTSTDFCCTLSGGSTSSSGGVVFPTGCSADTTVDCSGSGADGYSCASGDNPEAEDSTLSCSTPVTDSSGNDTYCCFTWSAGDSTCSPDDGLTAACPDPTSYGYSCDDPTDDPTTLDPGLTCSDGVADPDGVHTDFCCTY
jgi:hypothetical protein